MITDLAPPRACCPECGHRFPWPPGAPPTAVEPLVRPRLCCPSCHLVVPVVEEPCDEVWWAAATGQKPRPPAAQPRSKAQARPPAAAPAQPTRRQIHRESERQLVERLKE